MITMKATAELQKKIAEELLEDTNEENIEELKKILAEKVDENNNDKNNS